MYTSHSRLGSLPGRFIPWLAPFTSSRKNACSNRTRWSRSPRSPPSFQHALRVAPKAPSGSAAPGRMDAGGARHSPFPRASRNARGRASGDSFTSLNIGNLITPGAPGNPSRRSRSGTTAIIPSRRTSPEAPRRSTVYRPKEKRRPVGTPRLSFPSASARRAGGRRIHWRSRRGRRGSTPSSDRVALPVSPRERFQALAHRTLPASSRASFPDASRGGRYFQPRDFPFLFSLTPRRSRTSPCTVR